MSLSIYTVKHPLALNWSSHIRNREVEQNQRIELIQKLSISLIYEALRNLVQVDHLYLKSLNHIHELHILANNPICIISSNSSLLNMLFRDLTFFIPNLTLSNKFADNNPEIQNTTKEYSLTNNTSSKNIIILEENLDCKKMLTTINQLSGKERGVQKLTVCCIDCHTTQLQELGETYNKLDIYTVNIISDNI
uniref:Uracil phosphoribosyltransferase n=1 Tax=Scinaia undulata TaxID=1884664 RepID=A0A1G4NXW3_9FLOR|nr:Uracil phosphoribosyltransferase [Scinaia undulata]SCW23492.1 Uracil phosphoribosyltransferase [Scinaia undulata]